MTLARRLEPEWLDSLPADDPRAMRSRRDLRRINALMLQARIMQQLLTRHADESPRTILELGGGDGTFMLEVAGRMAPRWRDVTVMLLDRQNTVSDATRTGFRTLGWTVEPMIGDVFELLKQPLIRRVDTIVANLFLHHFAPEQLAWLTEKAARLAPLFVACEPWRGLFPLLGSGMLWAVGCNDVSRQDAQVSVRAGFRGRELSALWPKQAQWDLHERRGGLFTHCFVARLRQGWTPA